MAKWAITLIASLASGYLYHAGGLSKGSEDPWIPQFLRRSWVRDWLCPLFSLIVLFTWWRPEQAKFYLLASPSYILEAIAFSSYWSWLTCLWRGDKDKYWENWFLHGFFVGASFFPFCWAGIAWYWLLASSIVSGLLMMWISCRTGKSWLEECGRGFVAAGAKIILCKV